MIKQGLLKILGLGLIVAGGIVSNPSISSAQNFMNPQDRRNLENMAIIQGSIGALNPYFFARNHKDYMILESLRRMNMTMAIINENHLRNESLRYLGDSFNNQNQNSQNEFRNNRDPEFNYPRTFLCNGFIDKNNNGYGEFNEFENIDKSEFMIDEPISIVAYFAKNERNKRYSINVFNPKGEEINNQEGEIKNLFYRIENIDKHRNGPGTYVAMFFYDGELWEAKSFQVLEKPGRISMNVYNYYKDFNSDNDIDEDELIGMNNSEYRSNESLTLGAKFETSGVKDKKVEIKLYNPKGEEILNNSTILLKDNCLYHIGIDIKETLKKYGPGTYVTAVFNEGNCLDKRAFRLID
ncbi:MAG: hypothetical protein WC867_08245 [Candidatus Pacearchaeota archaeon]|jgi:hypothetical protein